jgi:hypothetical protein
MDPTFVALRDRRTPKFNHAIASGIATVHIPKALSFIDQVWKSISREFPDCLVYRGFERCLPTEEYREGAKKRSPTKTAKRVETKLKKAPKTAFDVARSDVFLVKFKFKFREPGSDRFEDLPDRFLYLPFVTKGGLTTIAGSRFAISPVLQDIVISPDDDNVFAQLLCIKLIFRRVDYVYEVDNRNRSVQLVWSTIYNKTPDMKKLQPTIKMETTLAHYLFCKYGVTETFQKYYGIDPHFGTEDDINRENYPVQDWVICESRGWRPDGNPRMDFVRSRIKVAIPRNQFDKKTEDLVGSFFYLVDHFPKRMILKDIDNLWLWKVLLGHILWTGDMNEGLLHDKVRDHFKSIDQYMDLITQYKLKSIGITVSNTYDFFVHVMKNCNSWILQDSDRISSMYGKELSTLNYVLYDITHSIVETNFAIHTAYRRSLTDPKRPLTRKTIEEIFKKKLKPGVIFRITNGRPGVSSIAIPGDNMAFKLTTLLVPQTSSSKKGARRDSGSAGSSKILDASIAPCGGYLNIQKKTPTGRTRQNVYGSITPEFITMEPPKFAALLRQTNDKFKRR